MDAVEVSVTPFADDPHAADMKNYVNKEYRFVFAKDVPGGVYSIQTLVPGEDDVLMSEQLTFVSLKNAG